MVSSSKKKFQLTHAFYLTSFPEAYLQKLFNEYFQNVLAFFTAHLLPWKNVSSQASRQVWQVFYVSSMTI